jgi:hypothetical protein
MSRVHVRCAVCCATGLKLVDPGGGRGVLDVRSKKKRGGRGFWRAKCRERESVVMEW